MTRLTALPLLLATLLACLSGCSTYCLDGDLKEEDHDSGDTAEGEYANRKGADACG